MGKPFELTAPVAPPEVARTIFTADQAVRDAMEAPLAGDFKAVDRLEVTYLNVLVRIGELKVRDADGTLYWWHDPRHAKHWTLAQQGLAPFVLAYMRSFGPSCIAALEWRLMPSCRRCIGRLRRVDCRICGGDWHVGEVDGEESIYTTCEGVLLEEPA